MFEINIFLAADMACTCKQICFSWDVGGKIGVGLEGMQSGDHMRFFYHSINQGLSHVAIAPTLTVSDPLV
jgi:hypothetical protein